MQSAGTDQWLDPNAGVLIYEAQERYRAELRRSFLALAHKHIKNRRLSDNTQSCSYTNVRDSSENSRSSKSVAAHQRDGFARELSHVQMENQKLKRSLTELQAQMRENELYVRDVLKGHADRENEEGMRAAELRIAELTLTVEAKQRELDEVQYQKDRLGQENRDLASKLALADSDSVTARDHIKAIETDLIKVEEELATAENEKNENHRIIGTLNHEVDEAMCQMDALKSKVSQYDIEHKRLNAEIADLKLQLSQLETQRTESLTYTLALEEKLEAQKRDLIACEESEKRSLAAIADHSMQKEELSSALNQTQAQLNRLVSEQKQGEQLLDELKSSLDTATTELNILRGVEQDLEAERQAHYATHRTLTAALNQEKELQSTILQTEETYKVSKEEILSLKEQLTDSSRMNDQIRAALVVESNKLRLQQELVAELQGENAELTAKGRVVRTECDQEHARLVEIKKEAMEANNNYRKVKASLKESEHIIQKFHAEIEELNAERMELAQGFEKEMRWREALQTSLHSTEYREQYLIAELKEQNRKVAIQSTAQANELEEARRKVTALEQELCALQTRQPNDLEGLNVLRADFKQAESLLIQERQKNRRLQNQIQDLKGNIRVVARVRPSKSNFLSNLSLSSDAVTLREMQSTCKGVREVVKEYHFDRVFGPDTSNQAVCEETEYLIQSALDGSHVCIFAYGQTGSGKTWTMGSSDGVSMSAITAVMEASAKSQDEGSTYDYTIKAESVEIYNEQFRDLLDDSPMLTGPVSGFMTGPISRHGRPSMPFHATSDNCSTRDGGSGVALKMNDKTRLPELVGTRKVVMKTVEDARRLFAKAARARSVAATAANSRSSRSHFVFILHVERRCKHATNNNKVQNGILNLVDLAGSERLSHSRTTGDRLVETTAINSSLSTLGNVIKTLANREPLANISSEPGQPPRPIEHLTYRDSKLTFLLQGSLSGNSKALLLATLSPEESHASETKSTLQFAETASRATVRH